MKKYQTIVECIKCKGKLFVKFLINIGKHELVVSVDAFKDGDWQEIQFTWLQGVYSLGELTQKGIAQFVNPLNPKMLCTMFDWN